MGITEDDTEIVMVSEDLKNWKYSTRYFEYKNYKKGSFIIHLHKNHFFSDKKYQYVTTGLYGLLMTSENLLDWEIKSFIRELVGNDHLGPRDLEQPIWNGKEYLIPLTGTPYVLTTTDFESFNKKRINLPYEADGGLDCIINGLNGKFFTVVEDGKNYRYLWSKDLYNWKEINSDDGFSHDNINIDRYGFFIEGETSYICVNNKVNVIPKCEYVTLQANTLNIQLNGADLNINNFTYKDKIYIYH